MKRLARRYAMLPMIAAFLAVLFTGFAAVAQERPASVNPTASSVKEQQLLDALKGVSQGTPAVAGRVTIPDKRSGNLIQPGGQDWRSQHESTVPFVGAVAVLGVLALLIVFYLIRGRIPISGGRSGRTITRFGFFERFTHWMTATAFLLLGFTGLNMTFGKRILLPVIGPDSFAALTQLGKFVHNYVSFAFALGVLLMFLLWVKDNFPHPRDLLWFAKGGGLLGFHVNAGRFNAGQKVIFWTVVLGGALLSFTGYIMMFPFQFTDLAGQQYYTIIHALVGLIMLAVIFAHIYIGSVGMDGAIEAMGSGEVDLNWAKEHHSIWVDRTLGEKSVPAE